jgi:hypothetical protein
MITCYHNIFIAVMPFDHTASNQNITFQLPSDQKLHSVQTTDDMTLSGESGDCLETASSEVMLDVQDKTN